MDTLTQIEANVLIHIQIKTTSCQFIFPLWECQLDEAALAEYAARCALIAVEDVGCGYAYVEVYDFRKETT